MEVEVIDFYFGFKFAVRDDFQLAVVGLRYEAVELRADTVHEVSDNRLVTSVVRV